MRKPSEINADIKAVIDATPALRLSVERRKEFLTEAQLAQVADAEECIEALKQEKAMMIERAAHKLRLLRDHMVANKQGKEFGAFRFAGTEMASKAFLHVEYNEEGFAPGGCYCQPEDDRERFIDAKLAEFGIPAE